MANRVNFTLPTNIGNVLDPVNAQDAATKNYVDTRPGGGSDKSYSIRVGAVYQAQKAGNSFAFPAGTEFGLIYNTGLTATFTTAQTDGNPVTSLTVTGMPLVADSIIIAALDGSWNVTQAYVTSTSGTGTGTRLTFNVDAVFNSNAGLAIGTYDVEIAPLLAVGTSNINGNAGPANILAGAGVSVTTERPNTGGSNVTVGLNPGVGNQANDILVYSTSKGATGQQLDWSVDTNTPEVFSVSLSFPADATTNRNAQVPILDTGGVNPAVLNPPWATGDAAIASWVSNGIQYTYVGIIDSTGTATNFQFQQNENWDRNAPPPVSTIVTGVSLRRMVASNNTDSINGSLYANVNWTNATDNTTGPRIAYDAVVTSSGTTVTANANEQDVIDIADSEIRQRVGEAGGSSWSPTSSPFTGSLVGLEYDSVNLRLIGLDANGRVSVTTDGQTFNTVTSQIAPSLTFTGLAIGQISGANVYIAIAASGRLYRSTDLTTWTLQQFTVTNTLTDIYFANGIFLITQPNTTSDVLAYKSADGLTWTNATIGITTGGALVDIAYGSGTWVAVGTGGLCRTSQDAVTWSIQDAGTTDNLTSIAYALVGSSSTFIATCSHSGAAQVLRSTNGGVTWTAITVGTDSVALNSVAYDSSSFASGGNVFIAVGADSTTLTYAILTSVDGAVWNKVSITTPGTLTSVGVLPYRYVVAGSSTGALIANPTNTNFVFQPEPRQSIVQIADGEIDARAVTGLNTVKGNVSLVGAGGTTVTQNGQTITITGGGTPGTDVWTIGYENIPVADLKAVLGAKNRATVLGGNNTDGIVIGNAELEEAVVVSGIPALAVPNVIGKGRFGTKTYAGANGNVYEITLNTSTNNATATQMVGSLANCLTFEVETNGLIVQFDNSGDINPGNYIVTVGQVGSTDQARPDPNVNIGRLAFYDGSNVLVQIFACSIDNTSEHIVVTTGSGTPQNIVEYEIAITGTAPNRRVALTGNKVALPRKTPSWDAVSTSLGRVSYAIDNAGDLYRINFANSAVTLVESGFVTNFGPNDRPIMNANAEFVVAVGESGDVSRYDIVNNNVIKFEGFNEITNLYGVSTDASGNIDIVGSNAAANTVYLGIPTVSVINTMVAPTKLGQLLDSTGSPVPVNQLFVAGNTGVHAIPAGTSGQVLTSNGTNAPSWSTGGQTGGGQFKGAYTSSAPVSASQDILLIWPQTANTLSALTYSSGVFTASRACTVAFSMNIVFTGLTGCTEADVYFTQNGVVGTGTRIGQDNKTDTTALTSNLIIDTTWIFRLASGDTIRSYVWANGSTGYNVGTAAFGNSSSRIEVVELA